MFKIIKKIGDWLKHLFNQEEAEYGLQFKEHQDNYKCHICKKPSDGPITSYTSIETPTGLGTVYNASIPVYDWDIPLNLELCKSCGQWTCINHLNHEKICQFCRPT